MIDLQGHVVRFHPLVVTLLAEMHDALACLEAGDYDAAHRVLEAVMRPENPLVGDLPRSMPHDLTAARIYREIVAKAPPGLLRREHSMTLSLCVPMLANAQRHPELLNDCGSYAALVAVMGSCGLELESTLDD